MNETLEASKKDALSTFSDKMSNVTDYSIKSDYDVTLQLIPKGNGNTPACSHHFKGNLKHNMLGLLAVGGIIAGAAAFSVVVVHACCSLMCRH